ncbi:hypothetical protein OTB20_21020 [Streptomyces sp. H27-H1]|uniref:hypothetical protein n=1 Tax=Streptomyces sp. H27-H1 TaxID=2996461 RepID=UPI00226EB73E|nr:hypothetical protein [Streptomyces sp. H27-H1]MCY0928641.1 hypothetical protein [Streptomyces sp. H27-H1]
MAALLTPAAAACAMTMGFMWLVTMPPSANPLTDDHWILAVAGAVVATTAAATTSGSAGPGAGPRWSAGTASSSDTGPPYDDRSDARSDAGPDTMRAAPPRGGAHHKFGVLSGILHHSVARQEPAQWS